MNGRDPGATPGPGWWTQTGDGTWVAFGPEGDGAEPPSPSPVDGDREVVVELTDDERRRLVVGLLDWGGPAVGTDSLAVALGFSGLDELHLEAQRIVGLLQADAPLTLRDWSRTLAATEIAFASDLLGTGSEWTCIQGGHDRDWIEVLRGLQSKVPASRAFLGP